MEKPIAIFCRAKPQGADALNIFDQAKMVFIGYPLLKKNETYNPHNLKKCLVSPDVTEDNNNEWRDALEAVKKTNMFSKNHNLCERVIAGSIVVIPRPEQGAAYIAKITKPFEIVDDPEWANAYLALREEQGLDRNDEDNQHIADVAQGWPIDEYRKVSLAKIPGWLRKSMLGRSTFGYLGNHPLQNEVTAHSFLKRLIEGTIQPDSNWTTDIATIKERLVAHLSPSSFEHLVVSLLQSEYPNQIWQQSGGPGDGGIDGLGCNEKGEMIGILQCKYSHDGSCELRSLESDPNLRRYFAVLLPEKPKNPTNGTILLGLDWVAEKLLCHHKKIPLALSLRVGEL